MKRRTFLIGTASGLSIFALAACTTPKPVPTPSVTPTASPSLIPRPQAMRRTSWSADPFARGSFSFQAVGSTPEHRTALREPVLDRLFFAGEATAIDAPGTVQGARDSGLRAAREVEAAATAGERIAVIGAGMAGISAARRLKNAGYSVVVIEARGRVGGRIETVTDDAWPFPIELGPSFIRDAAASSIDAELMSLGVETLPFTGGAETRTEKGDIVEVPSIGADAVAAAIAWAAGQPQDVSIAQALTDSGASDLSSTDAANGVSDADWLEHEVATTLEPDTGASVDQLSAWYGPNPSQGAVSLDDDLIVVGGYATLVIDAAVDLDLLASSVVTRIAYDSEGVSLRLATGESLSADRVIVTVPLGVLKTDAMEFDPSLPFAHRGAIAALGMGVLDKVWLRFDEPFWSTDAPLWMTVGGGSDFPVWINMLPLTGDPVLMGLVTAESAVSLADVDEDEFVAAALRSLEPFAEPGAGQSSPTGSPD